MAEIDVKFQSSLFILRRVNIINLVENISTMNVVNFYFTL